MGRSPYRRDYDSSSLWNIFHGPCQRLYTAWNTSVRIAFDVPRETHRYLIEEISECLHPQQMLVKRFLKFHETLQKTEKTSIKFLSKLSEKNLRTIYGQNLWNISHSCNEPLNNLTARNVGTKFKYVDVPEKELWRIDVIKNLLELKWNESEIINFDVEKKELDDLLEYLCTS